ncbi:MAG: glycosyltransferase family 2 protein [Clostridiales bacterium]|jgi:glycosyltransferase involved in cell wall biosynthesis|nr:glycosyltransferase family 2 protein [Eubacteriales bacterium]MDH7567626.1 glycosyltransferase family 2 protein [Clostridiales bacterium]
MQQDNDSGVSIITCTHFPYYMENIFDNYDRQSHKVKELIIILNNSSLNIFEWLKKSESYKDVKIFFMPEQITLGSCMNFAVSQAKYDYIANFDHDDYYGPKYLNDFVEVAPYVDAGLLGKKTHYVYIEDSQTMALLHPEKENCYVDYMDGRTMFMKKSIFDKVKFIDNDISDWQFSLDCQKNGIKIYSVNRFNYAYIRKKDINLHTWKMDNNEILKQHCRIIGNVQDYKSYVDR